MSFVLVAAGVCIESERVLVSRRRAGTHLAGHWEFPGGKVGVDEDPRDALVRELREELGIEVEVAAPLEVTFHRYPETTVLLLFFEVTRTTSSPEPQALEVAEVRWVDDDALGKLDFPAADLDVLAVVRRRLRAPG